jgi:hypothetical protein
MAYEFAGFFARAELAVLEDALAAWSGCRGRTITEPFLGIGVAVPDRALTYGKPKDAGTQARELAHRLEEELVTWSLRHPATRFVFLHAECFGGACQYRGYVCQNGVILEQAEDPDLVRGLGDALPRLVRALGVEFAPQSMYFAPFTRGYFDSTP